MPVHIVDHPLVHDALADLRNKQTTPHDFRRSATRISVLLAAVAMQEVHSRPVTVETPLGPIRFKIATRDGRVLNASPEFEDCAKAAAAHGLAIKEVQALALKAWLDANSR